MTEMLLTVAALAANATEAEPGDALRRSVRASGVLTALVVRRRGDGWEVVDGHRRLAAARAAGLSEVPVVVDESAPEAADEPLGDPVGEPDPIPALLEWGRAEATPVVDAAVATEPPAETAVAPPTFTWTRPPTPAPEPPPFVAWSPETHAPADHRLEPLELAWVTPKQQPAPAEEEPQTPEALAAPDPWGHADRFGIPLDPPPSAGVDIDLADRLGDDEETAAGAAGAGAEPDEMAASAAAPDVDLPVEPDAEPDATLPARTAAPSAAAPLGAGRRRRPRTMDAPWLAPLGTLVAALAATLIALAGVGGSLAEPWLLAVALASMVAGLSLVGAAHLLVRRPAF